MLRRLSGLILVACAALLAQAPKRGEASFTLVNSITRQPVANARLTLQGPARETTSYETGPDGRWSIANLASGRYALVTIEAKGYTYASFSVTFNIRDGESFARTVELVPHGEIHGTVTDESGTPIEGASVNAQSYMVMQGEKRLRTRGIAFTDAKGQFALKDVEPIGVFLRASFPSYRQARSGLSFAASYYPNVETVDKAQRVAVSPGQTVENVNLRLRSTPAFHIRGRAVGLPESSEKLVISIRECGAGPKDQTAPQSTTRLQQDGTFDATGLQPGPYCVVLDAKGPAPEYTPFFHAQQTVTVVDRDIEGVQLVAIPPKEISAVVTLEPGANLRMPGKVYLFPDTPYPLRAISAEPDPQTGAFQLKEVLADDYRITVNAPPGGYVKSMKYGFRELAGGALNTSGETATLTIEIAAARGELKGKVAGIIQSTAGVAMVTVSPTGALSGRDDLLRMMPIRSTGDFEFPALAPGDYRVHAWETYKPDLMSSQEFIEQFLAPSVHIVEGQPATVDLRLIPTADIEQAKLKF